MPGPLGLPRRRLLPLGFALILGGGLAFVLVRAHNADEAVPLLPSRRTELVRDPSGRLLEVTSPIGPTETDLEFVGGTLACRAGPLASWKTVPIGERLAATGEHVVYTTALKETVSFERQPDGSFSAPPGSVRLAADGHGYVLTDGAGRKHFFSREFPLLLRVESPTGETLHLTFKPEGALIRLQSSSGAGYSFTWNDRGLLERVLDETTGKLWTYAYDEGGAARTISVARPVPEKRTP